MELSAKGLRAIVTAGAGIGRVIAQTFVEAGARVQTCQADPKTNPDDVPDVERFFDRALAQLGGLDVLVSAQDIANMALFQALAVDADVRYLV